MIIPQIPARIRRLHDQLLPIHRPARKSELITSTAPIRLVAPRDIHRRPAIRDGLVDSPGSLRRTHEGITAVIAAGLGVAAVVQGPVILVAGSDW